jgi:hypothetical protein
VQGGRGCVGLRLMGLDGVGLECMWRWAGRGGSCRVSKVSCMLFFSFSVFSCFRIYAIMGYLVDWTSLCFLSLFRINVLLSACIASTVTRYQAIFSIRFSVLCEPGERLRTEWYRFPVME